MPTPCCSLMSQGEVYASIQVHTKAVGSWFPGFWPSGVSLGIQMLFYLLAGQLRWVWDLPGWRKAVLLWHLFEVFSRGLSHPAGGNWKVCEMLPLPSDWGPSLWPRPLPLPSSYYVWMENEQARGSRVQQYDAESRFKMWAVAGGCFLPLISSRTLRLEARSFVHMASVLS